MSCIIYFLKSFYTTNSFRLKLELVLTYIICYYKNEIDWTNNDGITLVLNTTT